MTRTAKPSRRGERWAVGHIGLTLVALAIVWGSIGLSLQGERRASTADAWNDADNLVRAFAETIDRVVENIDQTLLHIRSDYNAKGPRFDLAAWVQAHPISRGSPVPIVLIDAAGLVTQSANDPSVVGIDVADREPFKVQAVSLTDALQVGTFSTGRITGQPTIVFSRKLLAPDGSFAGEVAALLDPTELARFYESVSIGRGSITLMTIDGTVLARRPDGAKAVGQTLNTPYTRLMRTGPGSGHLVAVSALDGMSRIYSYRRLDDPPMLISVGLSEADVYATYWNNRRIGLVAGLAISGGIIGAALIMIRQRARLLRSKEILAAALENMTQGIQMVEPDGTVGVINSRAIELLGIPQTLLDRKPTFPEIIAWQMESGEFGDPSSYPEGLRETLAAGGIAPVMSMYERTRPNGTVLEITTKPMSSGGAVRTYTDITGRKRTEAALADARDAAEASGRARMEFLAMMSHEIRTPMNSIIGFTSLLMDMPLTATVQQYVRIIRQSGNHLLQLIDDILDLSKLDAGKLQLEDEPFDLGEEIGQTIELMEAQAQAKQLTLSAEISPRVPRRVYGDPGRLRQILINLVSNGLKFSSVGGVTVQVMTFRDETDAGRLSFQVVDSGIGIPPEKIGLLFRHFSQISDGNARQYGGTGLGLAICKRLVEQMGGNIGVQSAPGSGSIFYFDLPLRPAAETSPAPVNVGSLRILLADDNSTNRMVIARMLERQGHRVDIVGNGLEAVETVRTRPYDLIVMDIAMPEMDGLAATEAIRDMTGRRGRIPIIGLTANAAGSAEEDCYRAGMSAFMTKPVTPERLAQAVGRAMASLSVQAGLGE